MRVVPKDDPILQNSYGDLIDFLNSFGFDPIIIEDNHGIYKFKADPLLTHLHKNYIGIEQTNNLWKDYHDAVISQEMMMEFDMKTGRSLSSFWDSWAESVQQYHQK